MSILVLNRPPADELDLWQFPHCYVDGPGSATESPTDMRSLDFAPTELATGVFGPRACGTQERFVGGPHLAPKGLFNGDWEFHTSATSDPERLPPVILPLDGMRLAILLVEDNGQRSALAGSGQPEERIATIQQEDLASKLCGRGDQRAAPKAGYCCRLIRSVLEADPNGDGVPGRRRHKFAVLAHFGWQPIVDAVQSGVEELYRLGAILLAEI